MGKKRKKIGTATTAIALILALGLAGTFAWSGGEDSDGDIEDTMAPEVKLHDDNDFADTQTVNGIRNRDIYVENAGNTKLYIRVRLNEYMEVGGRSLIPGATKADKSSWKPHTYQGGDNGICGQEFHDYFEWKMGNTAPLDYKSRVKNYYDDTTIVRDKQTGTATIVSMKEYHEAQVKPTDCWVVDTDGYAYWYTQLDKDTATGLLLDSIRNLGDIDETYYYGVNAKLEAVTESDLDSWLNGTAPTGSTTAANRATAEGVQFLKDISPSYVKITDAMNATNPKANDFDVDSDNYLTKKEYQDYINSGGIIRLQHTVFPDQAFLDAVKAAFDTDNSNTLTPDEVFAATSLDVSNKGIENLQGVEKLTSLTSLDCSGNKLTKLDLSGNPNIISLIAGGQAPEIKLTYNVSAGNYESQKGIFLSGTAFTNGGAANPDITLLASGGITVDNYMIGKVSDFSLSISRARSVLGTLSGTVGFTPNEKMVSINSVNFPDNNLRTIVLRDIDKDADYQLSSLELYSLKTLDLSNQGITNLKGLEYFPALTKLDCSQNRFTHIDLNETPYLTTLDISDNQLEKLDLYQLPLLTQLDCSNNQLRTLDVSKNPALNSVLASGQTINTAMEYDASITKYKSVAGIFEAGTTFGNIKTTLDPLSGTVTIPSNAVTIDTYNVAIRCLNGSSIDLSGTVNYTKSGSLKESVKNIAVDGTINIDGSQWLVLTNDGVHAELLAKDCVSQRGYSTTGVYIKWSESPIRDYLKGTYYNNLSDDMKAAIEPVTLSSPTNAAWTTNENTTDTVYLLANSGKTALEYLTVVTASGRKIESKDDLLKSNGTCWWLRTPGPGGANIAVGCVASQSGEIYNLGTTVDRVYGVRPAITLKLSQ